MGNIIVEEDDDYWDKTSDEIAKEIRLNYLKTFIKPQFNICPECKHHLIIDEYEIYCENCGLIASSSIRYVAGHKIDLPQGLRL